MQVSLFLLVFLFVCFYIKGRDVTLNVTYSIVEQLENKNMFFPSHEKACKRQKCYTFQYIHQEETGASAPKRETRSTTSLKGQYGMLTQYLIFQAITGSKRKIR